MTSAHLRLAAPTRLERGLLDFADRITRVIERRMSRRAQRRDQSLDLLREEQTRRHDPREVDHLLALAGAPRR